MHPSVKVEFQVEEGGLTTLPESIHERLWQRASSRAAQLRQLSRECRGRPIAEVERRVLAAMTSGGEHISDVRELARAIRAGGRVEFVMEAVAPRD